MYNTKKILLCFQKEEEKINYFEICQKLKAQDLELWCVSVGSSIVNNSTTLMEDTDNGGGHACVGAEGIWEVSVPSS